ncbi:MAG: hypothetical protein IPL01_00200 [Acidobacteria bacterium]|nr:hypothetical protein [Acidobacteriota bacterium]
MLHQVLVIAQHVVVKLGELLRQEVGFFDRTGNINHQIRAAKRFNPSAIAAAALVWPPPVSDVMIRNFLAPSSSETISEFFSFPSII